MRSKKWIKTFAFVFVVIGVGQFLLVFLLKDSLIKKIFEETQTYSDAKFVLDNHIFPKYVFMGSSISRHSFIPKLISDRLNIDNNDVVNIGMSAATPYEMYLSYKKSQENFSNVNTFFYTIEPWIFLRSYFVHKKYEKILWTYDEWKYFSKKSGINNNYFNKFSLLIEMFGESQSTVSEDNGYMGLECNQFEKYTQTKLVDKFTDNVNVDYGISEFQLSYLKKLKNDIESNGAKFVIVYVPNHFSYYDNNVRYNQAFNKLLEARMNDAVGKTIQIGFFNPKWISLVDTDFSDTHHLCRDGAEKFSIYISSELKNLSKLEPTLIHLPFE